MKEKTYASPYDFRKALETRLKQKVEREGLRLDDLRKQVTFERFLSRLDFNRYCLKGGYSLQMRLSETLSTIDIDLAVNDRKLLIADRDEQNRAILEDLRNQAKADGKDYFAFDVVRVLASLPDMKDGGCRCLVTATIGNQYYQQFHVDVALELRHILPPEHISTRETLMDAYEYVRTFYESIS
jgi:hypothetical protein